MKLLFPLLVLCWVGSWTTVSANEAMVRYLLNSKASLINQMQHQIQRARLDISAGLSAALEKYTAEIEEARRFATDETAWIATYMNGVSDECLAEFPTTVPEILSTADNFLQQCIRLAVDQGEEIDRTYLDAIEGFQFSVNDVNLLFARDYFKRPEKVFTTDLYAEVMEDTRAKAIVWDNMDSIALYERRRAAATEVSRTDSAVHECIMDMKEFVATEIGRVFLYSWNC